MLHTSRIERKESQTKKTKKKNQAKDVEGERDSDFIVSVDGGEHNGLRGKFDRSYPCVRSTGPIICPKNRLPMPRDLWYRIVYSQALEQQLGRESVGRKKIPLLLDHHRRKRSGLNRVKRIDWLIYRSF